MQLWELQPVSLYYLYYLCLVRHHKAIDVSTCCWETSESNMVHTSKKYLVEMSYLHHRLYLLTVCLPFSAKLVMYGWFFRASVTESSCRKQYWCNYKCWKQLVRKTIRWKMQKFSMEQRAKCSKSLSCLFGDCLVLSCAILLNGQFMFFVVCMFKQLHYECTV